MSVGNDLQEMEVGTVQSKTAVNSGAKAGDAYSGLRIDIAAGRPLSVQMTPLVSCRSSDGWVDADPQPITLER